MALGGAALALTLPTAAAASSAVVSVSGSYRFGDWGPMSAGVHGFGANAFGSDFPDVGDWDGLETKPAGGPSDLQVEGFGSPLSPILWTTSEGEDEDFVAWRFTTDTNPGLTGERTGTFTWNGRSYSVTLQYIGR